MISAQSRTLAAVFLLSFGLSNSIKVFAEDSVSTTKAQQARADALIQIAVQEFKPLPKHAATPHTPITPERVSLGRQLFFDPRFSDDGTVSCHRCHLASMYGSEGLPTAIGAHDMHAPRNAPTILNSALQIAIHWRGEFKSVEEQAQVALIGPAFGNKDYAVVVARLKAIPGYEQHFKDAFPDSEDPITAENWGRAVGAYERALITPSRFDDYLAGKKESLTAAEINGLVLFKKSGCTDCHNGPGVGGGSFEKFGVVEDYWKATGSKTPDHGRKDVTKKDSDDYVFKVPMLRNVEMTAPYFHDGSVKTLPEAVKVMARVQGGKTLSDEDTTAIVTFLKSLTAPLPKTFLESPVLPPASFSLMP